MLLIASYPYFSASYYCPLHWAIDLPLLTTMSSPRPTRNPLKKLWRLSRGSAGNFEDSRSGATLIDPKVSPRSDVVVPLESDLAITESAQPEEIEAPQLLTRTHLDGLLRFDTLERTIRQSIESKGKEKVDEGGIAVPLASESASAPLNTNIYCSLAPTVEEMNVSRLCTRCSKQNLKQILANAPAKEYSTISLGQPAKWKSTTCPVCQFFYQCYTLNQIPKLWNASYKMYVFRRARLLGDHGNAYPAFAILEARQEHSRRVKKWTLNDIEDRGFICSTSDDPLEFHLLGSSVNYDDIRAWIRYCNSEHGCWEAQLETKMMLGLTLIDCEKRCTVPSDGSVRFVALSYVSQPYFLQTHVLTSDLRYGDSLPTKN